MESRFDAQKVAEFLAVLDLDEEPLGMMYSTTRPQGGVSPKRCTLPDRDSEAAGTVDWGKVFGSFSCIFRHLLVARRRDEIAWFDPGHFGCLGGAFFLGFLERQLDAIACYISTGAPGVGAEHYADSPDKAHDFFNTVSPRPAPRPYAIFKKLGRFTQDEPVELVVFFGRPEQLSGLHQLAFFVTNDPDVVISPFGSGCANLVSWPLVHAARGKQRVVLGGWDPSMRPYLGVDELVMSMPVPLFEGMLERWSESFLVENVWQRLAPKRRRKK